MQSSNLVRRRLTAATALLCCFLFGGCSAALRPVAATPEPTPSPTASPSPVPTPSPFIAVFGAEASSAFAESLQSAAQAGGYPVSFESGSREALGAFRTEARCAAVVLLEDASDALPETGVPVFAFAAKGQRVSPDVPHLTYAGVYAAETALAAAIAYPPHETPVRLIGLFDSATGDAYAVWQEAASDGRVFAKAELFFSAEDAAETAGPGADTPSPSPDAADQLSELFGSFYPGMIDGVFAETGALAVEAVQALASLGRDDIEVFSAATDANAQSLLSPLFVLAVGADYAEAGALCYSAASSLLEGESVSSSVMLPKTFSDSSAP